MQNLGPHLELQQSEGSFAYNSSIDLNEGTTWGNYSRDPELRGVRSNMVKSNQSISLYTQRDIGIGCLT